MSSQARVEPNLRLAFHDGTPMMASSHNGTPRVASSSHDGTPSANSGSSAKFLDLTSSKAYDPSLGITPHQGPHHPRLVTLESRLATFHTWPPGLKQRPDQMARAGFFYEGVSDQVKCFSCDGGLGSWDEGDSPEEEHAKWFPGCTYLQLTYNPVRKGSEPLTIPSNTECARALKKEDTNTIGSKVVSLEELSEDKD